MAELGFTGTQRGMTKKQLFAVMNIMQDSSYETGHHGDCIGADWEFHQLCRFKKMAVVGHPPRNQSKRAFCTFDVTMPSKEYIPRNHDIVDASGLVIVAPGEMKEVLRSGTWATYRYAKQTVTDLVIAYPDGSVKWF